MELDQVWRTIDEQRSSFAAMLDDLSDDEWEAPSLCDGWRVREVGAHLTLAQLGPAAAAVAFVRARGSFDRMVRDTAIRRAADPREGYAPAIRAMVGSRRTAPGVTALEPLTDVLVHGQDIAIPLGRERPVPAEAAAAAATRVWSMGFPFRARRRFSGLRLRADDHAWSAGDGELVEGPVASLLLVLTGRPAGLAALSGPGLAEATARMGGAQQPRSA